MGTIIRFPRRKRHARNSAGSRAAKRVIKSDVTPAAFALSVAKTADHHSEGILSRLSHLRTAQGPAPTSAAIASRDSQRSMIERNEFKSDMTEIMGPTVPKSKAITSHDSKSTSGQNVPMPKDHEEIAESAWRDAFRARVREAQGGRKDKDVAKLLGISPERYRKYVSGGEARKTIIPPRYLTKFCLITDRPLEWLLDGDEVAKPLKEPVVSKPKGAQRA